MIGVKRSSLQHLDCSIARSLDLIGEWWTLLVVRDVFFGLHRFDAIRDDLGISRNILTDRLHTLVEGGVLERRPIESGHHEYHLTAKGRDLYPVLMAIMQWGDTWEAPTVRRGCCCTSAATSAPPSSRAPTAVARCSPATPACPATARPDRAGRPAPEYGPPADGRARQWLRPRDATCQWSTTSPCCTIVSSSTRFTTTQAWLGTTATTSPTAGRGPVVHATQ